MYLCGSIVFLVILLEAAIYLLYCVIALALSAVKLLTCGKF
jgi:hypothetical protein